MRKRKRWAPAASRGFNLVSGLLMLVVNGGQQQERLLNLGGGVSCVVGSLAYAFHVTEETLYVSS